MTTYKHTQIGYLMLFVLFAITLLYGIILTQTGLEFLVVLIMAFVIFILSCFLTLQVMIDENYLRVKFTCGIFKKRFLLKDIVSAKKVKNHWYYGWGIRLWMWPYMWVYNVSGFNAIEITTKNNKIYRIGTDEPDKLEQAILQSIQQAK